MAFVYGAIMLIGLFGMIACSKKQRTNPSMQTFAVIIFVFVVIAGVLLMKEKVDGIILVSAFPCGPDSMTNELLIRRIKGVPILTLVLDTQSGMAGIETRLESFLDIIRFQKGERL